MGIHFNFFGMGKRCKNCPHTEKLHWFLRKFILQFLLPTNYSKTFITEVIVYEKNIWVSKSIELDRYEPRLFCSVNLHWLLSLFVEKIHCCTYNSFFSFVLFCFFMFYCIAGMGYKVYDLFFYLVWKDLGHKLLRSCRGASMFFLSF